MYIFLTYLLIVYGGSHLSIKIHSESLSFRKEDRLVNEGINFVLWIATLRGSRLQLHCRMNLDNGSVVRFTR